MLSTSCRSSVLGLLLSLLFISTSASIDAVIRDDAPRKWGFLAFPGADLMDVYGPMEMLFMVATRQYLEVTIITPTEGHVVLTPGMGNPNGSIYEPVIVGTATMQDDLDIDILVVPGGEAARNESMTWVDDYLNKKMPDLEYLITICTGATFAARGGLLEGRRATTNKAAWDTITAHGENITWVAPARYVMDDNIWSSSGVTAGLDLTLEFIRQHYGEDLYERIQRGTEHTHRQHDDDPWTDIIGVPHQGQEY